MRTLRVNFAVLALAAFGLISTIVGCASQTSPTSSADQAAQTRVTTISSVSASKTGAGVRVVIAADGPLTFSSIKQPDPPAVVLYFPETNLDQGKVIQPEGNDLISSISARQGNGQRTARLEIQLAAEASYSAAQEGNSVLVDLFKGGSGMKESTAATASSTSTEPQQEKATAAIAAAPASAAMSKPTAKETITEQAAAPASASTVTSKNGTAWVKKVDFVSEENGKSTVMVATTQPVDYRVNKVSPQRIEIRLLNTKIPSYHQRPLITTRFSSAVDRVTPFQLNKGKDESVISIELREAVPYFTEQTGDMVYVHFEASSIPPKPLEQAELPAWKQALSEGPSTESSVAKTTGGAAPMAAPVAAVAGPAQDKPIDQPAASISAVEKAAIEEGLSREDAEVQAMVAPRRKNYTGEKIALDFYETDIKNVFRILREVSGKNFAIDKDVTGKVTMTLDKPVPWDQVMDLVLRMNQLGMVEEGQIIRIATMETLRAEDELRKAKMESLRKAREEAKALEPLVTKYYTVSYSNADSEIKPHIEKLLTKDRGSVSIDEKNNQVIITDTLAVIKKAEEVIRRIDKVTSQVIIEARVVEVNETFSRELGIDWTMSYGPGGLNGVSTSTDMAMNFPVASQSSVGIGFSRLTGVPFVLNARLNAIETNGDGKILSSPKILTLDNKKATIKQGVEYPYLERDSSGGASVKFKNIDLLLEVTPHVTPDNRISMLMFLTKNDVGAILDGVPAVNTNEAKTELLVNDGDTVVIGGIIKSSENRGESGFPLLSKIPGLGWLFKQTSNKSTSNELLIFLTPRIVQLEQVMPTEATK